MRAGDSDVGYVRWAVYGIESKHSTMFIRDVGSGEGRFPRFCIASDLIVIINNSFEQNLSTTTVYQKSYFFSIEIVVSISRHRADCEPVGLTSIQHQKKSTPLHPKTLTHHGRGRDRHISYQQFSSTLTNPRSSNPRTSPTPSKPHASRVYTTARTARPISKNRNASALTARVFKR